jgi:putative endonuclease
MFYVYIIQSQKDGTYYKGFSENPKLRLEFHNQGQSSYTSKKTPWNLVGILPFAEKRQALEKEKKLKKYGHTSLIALLNSDQNKLLDYLNG